MQNNPLISVLIPYYNDENFLKEAIESVLNQTYENFELILINHASTDSSGQIAHSYNDARIVHFDMPRNEGASGAFIFPKFMELSKGDYLKPFCADDVMLPNCLEILINIAKENSDTEIIFTDAEYMDEDGKKLSVTWYGNRLNFGRNDSRMDMLIKYRHSKSFLPYISVLIKKNSFTDIELNNNFILMFDMSIWVQSLIKDKKMKLFDDVTVLYRIHKKQASGIEGNQGHIAGSFYELCVLSKLFYDIEDIETIKNLCINRDYVEKLEIGDERFIPFIMARDFLTSGPHYQQKLVGYLKLSEIFSDEKLRNEIYEKFGFGVKEFRELYTKVETCSNRKKLNAKRPKELNLLEVLYLLLRSFYNVVTFSTLRKKLRRKKEYTI